jgi:hypothetical protein
MFESSSEKLTYNIIIIIIRTLGLIPFITYNLCYIIINNNLVALQS